MAILTDNDISGVQRMRDVARAFTLSRAEEFVFTSMARKGPKPKSTLYEVPFKSRFTPSDNAVLDGQDVQNSEFINNEANKSMLQGRVQKSRVAIGVSDLAQEFGEEYAAEDLLAENLADGLVVARESMEVSCLKDGNSCPVNDPVLGPAAHMRGLTNWIQSANVGTDLPIPANALCPAGNIVAGIAAPAGVVTDTTFNGIMQSIATAAFMKGVWDVFVNPAMMAVIDGYSNMGQTSGANVPLRRFNTEMDDGTITMEVRMYQTSFGKLRFHLHYNLPANVWALIVQMEHTAIRPGYPIRTRPLPYLGGANKRIIEWVTGLDVTNPRSMGKITT